MSTTSPPGLPGTGRARVRSSERNGCRTLVERRITAAITERARRDLYERAEETWGKEAADTLMAHLPPTGWGDVATKSDLHHAVELLEARITATLYKELNKQTRVFFAMTLTAVIAVSGLPHVLGRIL